MTPVDVNSFVRSYIDLNIKLAKTLVIKSEASQDLINELIRLDHGAAEVDNLDPYSWKYYLNISGQYHPLDSVMTITSLDSLEEIDFTVENLKIHTASAEAYQFGSRYYYSLLSRYPNQEMLINGILYPVDITEAVNAKEGSILTYPKYLVEPQEITLITELEKYIQMYLGRWNVQAFGITDTLYNPAQHALLYLNIVPKLLNLRLKRCKTYEAHSFHIKQYLASHGRLDRYYPFMTLKQALYLYRNINYIERNSGKVEQFNELIQKFLTDRSIPISEFSIRQLGRFDTQYYPEITARRKAINPQYNIPEKDYIPLESVFSKEESLAYGNPAYYEANSSRDIKRFKNSLSSVIQTKDLESSMIDYNGAVPDSLEEVLVRQWVSMSFHGLYEAIVNFRDPKTSEVISLNARDAFIYMFYVTLSSIDIPVDRVPKYWNIKQRKRIKPTVEQLLSVTDKQFKDIPLIATRILRDQPVIKECFSISSFYKLAYQLYQQEYYYWFLISSIGDHYKRAQVANMVYQLYEDEYTILSTEDETIIDWLHKNNLKEYDYTLSQAQELMKNIFVQSTGLIIDDSKQLKNIQKAMIAILQQLSSYSVQFVTEINTSNIRPLNWAAIRSGNFERSYEGQQFIETEIGTTSFQGAIAEERSISSITGNEVLTVSFGIEDDVRVNVKTTVINTVDFTETILVDFKRFGITVSYPEYDETVSRDADYIGKEFYLALSDEQKLQIKSVVF